MASCNQVLVFKKLAGLILLLVFSVMLLISCTQNIKKKPAVSLAVSQAETEKLKAERESESANTRDQLIKKKKVASQKKTAKLIPVQHSVLVLLSSSSRSYQKLAEYVSRAPEIQAVEITLSGDPAQDNAVVRDIQASDTTQILAIGLKAARSVKPITNKQKIFAQIVNYHDYGLIADNFKGVSALPSPEKLFKDWKTISPQLSKVVVVIGNNMNSYLDRARKAAKAQGIQLIVKQVSSDKEFVYKSKNIRHDIQGQWILPDSRVLSSKALKEVMAYGSRRGREIVVFSPKLLSFGGLFYVSPDIKAMSDAVLLRLKQSRKTTNVPGHGILPVMNHTMGINQNIAQQLNLLIPPDYRKYINVE
ncbi:MAG TPA: hypothetical protein ENJ08_08095 [Gammaproteobacteria bacterium]|nr:hypothetical protein [Gammaproteobacteria bacterium]